MAGSYGHVNPTTGGKWSLIEDMGDAYECVEELLYLVRLFADSDYNIEKALELFHRFKRGEQKPNDYEKSGIAYLETQRVMEQDGYEDGDSEEDES